MNFLNLIYYLTAVLIFKYAICSETEDVSSTDDAVLGLILIQNSKEKNDLSEQEKNIIDKKVSKENFSSFFIKTVKNVRELFSKMETETRNLVNLNKNLLNLSRSLKMDDLTNLKLINRDKYLAYLKESIGSVNKFLPLFKTKFDGESVINVPKLIKEGVFELEKVEALFPKITEIIDAEKSEQKSAEFVDIKDILKHSEKQIEQLNKESEQYYKCVADFFEHYKNSDTHPERIKAYLVNLRNNSLFIKRNEIRNMAVSCNQFVAAFFRHFTTSCKIENALLNSICENSNDIWVSQGKIERYLKSIKNKSVEN